MYLASKQIYALKLCSLPVIFAGIDLYCLLCEFHSSLVQPLICSSFSSQHRGYVLSGLNSHCNAAIQTFIKERSSKTLTLANEMRHSNISFTHTVGGAMHYSFTYCKQPSVARCFALGWTRWLSFALSLYRNLAALVTQQPAKNVIRCKATLEHASPQGTSNSPKPSQTSEGNFLEAAS